MTTDFNYRQAFSFICGYLGHCDKPVTKEEINRMMQSVSDTFGVMPLYPEWFGMEKIKDKEND